MVLKYGCHTEHLLSVIVAGKSMTAFRRQVDEYHPLIPGYTGKKFTPLATSRPLTWQGLQCPDKEEANDQLSQLDRLVTV